MGERRADAARRRRVPRWAKVILVLVGVLTLLGSGAVVTAYALTSRYDSNVKRGDLLPTPSPGVRTEAPPSLSGPMNILMIGSDSRATEIYNPNDSSSSAGHVGGQRSDTMILFHLDRGLDHAYAISFHRDLYVPIATADGTAGYGNKLNAAFAFGGAPRLVQTLRLLTGIRVDHVVIVDFGAIRKITDQVGGVDVQVDRTTTDPRSKLTFTKGLNHLDGARAEAYVRQRYGLPADDYDRIHRQQQYLSALLAKVTSLGMLANPIKLDRLLLTITSTLTVDRQLPVKGLAFALRNFSASQITFMTVPTAGGRLVPGVGDAVVLDQTRGDELWRAIAADDVASYVKRYGASDPSHAP